MKKVFITTIYILLNIGLSAQEDINENRGYLAELKMGEAFTLVTDANVREKPSTQSTVLTKLPIGTAINVEKITTDSFTVNGYKAPWCAISYENGHKKGFLWGGFIATVVIKMADDYSSTDSITFLGGVSAWNEKNTKLTLQLRAMKQGKELSKLEIESPGDLSYNCAIKEERNGNFKNVKSMLTFSTGYEACGYPWADNLIFFTKDKKLVKILETTSVSDAGVFYSSEEFVLPYDKGGINNHIMVRKDEAQMEESGNDYVVKSQKYSLIIYKWDGAKLVKTKEIK